MSLEHPGGDTRTPGAKQERSLNASSKSPRCDCAIIPLPPSGAWSESPGNPHRRLFSWRSGAIPTRTFRPIIAASWQNSRPRPRSHGNWLTSKTTPKPGRRDSQPDLYPAGQAARARRADQARRQRHLPTRRGRPRGEQRAREAIIEALPIEEQRRIYELFYQAGLRAKAGDLSQPAIETIVAMDPSVETALLTNRRRCQS